MGVLLTNPERDASSEATIAEQAAAIRAEVCQRLELMTPHYPQTNKGDSSHAGT